MRKIISFFIYCLLSLQGMAQFYFNTKEKFGAYIDENGNNALSPTSLTPLDTQEVKTYFSKLSSDAWVAFGYPQNGCQYRAHTMARMLQQNKVANNKIWSFKPALVGDVTRTGDLNIPDPNFPGDKVVWVYHVAPVVAVRLPDNRIDTVVIDPSMFNKPVPYRIWLDSLHCPNQYFTFVNSKYVQYETTVANVLTGKWYSDNHAIDMRWIPTSLCKGKIFYQYIQYEILPLRKRLLELDLLIKNVGSLRQKNAYELEKKQLSQLYEERKKIATDSNKFAALPREYQAMLIDCQEAIMGCMFSWWDYISTDPYESCK